MPEKNIEKLSPKDIINRLKPCSYNYNNTKDLGERINFGFLAQDLLESFGPEYNFVNKDERDEYYKVNYMQFIAPIVSVLKEQEKEIELLKEKLKKIKD